MTDIPFVSGVDAAGADMAAGTATLATGDDNFAATGAGDGTLIAFGAGVETGTGASALAATGTGFASMIAGFAAIGSMIAGFATIGAGCGVLTATFFGAGVVMLTILGADAPRVAFATRTVLPLTGTLPAIESQSIMNVAMHNTRIFSGCKIDCAVQHNVG